MEDCVNVAWRSVNRVVSRQPLNNAGRGGEREREVREWGVNTRRAPEGERLMTP